MFGSFAKGTQHECSDVDVALVADNFTGIIYIKNNERIFRIHAQVIIILASITLYPG